MTENGKSPITCVSLELKQIECALKHDANALYVMADRWHILIVHGPKVN